MESINELIPGEIDEAFSDIAPVNADLLENITRTFKNDNDRTKTDIGKFVDDGPIQLEILQPGILLNEPNSNEINHFPNGIQFSSSNVQNFMENNDVTTKETNDKIDTIELLNNSETNKKMNIVYEIVQPEVSNCNYTFNDVDDFPTLTLKERKERKRMLSKTRSGRVSKPPKHLALNYKRIHLVDWNEEDGDVDSDGGYSDIHLSDKDLAVRKNGKFIVFHKLQNILSKTDFIFKFEFY